MTHQKYTELYAKLGLKKDPHKVLTDKEMELTSSAFAYKKKERDQHAYRAERLAFNIQGAFTKEFLAPDDCAQSYIDEHIQTNGLKLFTEVPDQFIFSAYQINSKNISSPKGPAAENLFKFDFSVF